MKMNTADKKMEVQVTHFTEDAYNDGKHKNWLDIAAMTSKPLGCTCNHPFGRCAACRSLWQRCFDNITDRVQEFTHRKGEHNGYISVDVRLVTPTWVPACPHRPGTHVGEPCSLER